MRFKSFTRWALAALALACVGGVAWAALTGSVTVNVTDNSGAPLPGATVTLSGPAQLADRSGVTNEGGVVRFNAVQPGSYKVVVAMDGFSPRTLENNPVRLDENTTVKVQLAEQVVEALTVTARPPTVDTASTAVGQDLGREFVDSLPIGRDYLTNFTRVPGVGTGSNPSVKGGTERDNLYLIDGVNTTDPVTGTFGANVNFEVIDQQSVTTSGHMAEYGGVVGLVSNVVTKSGGNDWSGSLTYFRNDADWQADRKAGAIAVPKTTDYNYAYTLGGPILKDRLWHFTSWQKVFSESTINPDRPPREFDGERPFAKLTWQINPSHRTQFQMNKEDATILNVNAADTDVNPEQFYKQIQGGPVYTAKYTGILGTNLILEGQLNLFRSNLDAVPQNPGLPPNTTVVELPGVEYGRYSNEQTSTRDRDELRLDLTWFVTSNWGEHNLKFGTSYAETDFVSTNINSGGLRYYDRIGTWGGTGRTFWNAASMATVLSRWRGLATINGWDCTIAGVDCATIFSTQGLPNDPTRWLMTVGGVTYNPAQFNFAALSANDESSADGNVRFWSYTDDASNTGSVGTKLLSLYAQDDWRMGKFNLRLGLRADKLKLLNSLGEEYYTFDTEIAPRIGLSYDPTGDGRSKIFAHAGRLYDPLRDNTASFSGSLSSPLSRINIWLGGPEGFASNYYPFFQSGGPGNADAVMAKNVKTPYTDELILGYARELGTDMSIEFNAYTRKTKNITEDFDPSLGAGLDTDRFPWLTTPTLAGLGFSDVDGDGEVTLNDLPAAYVIYNPPGAQREAKGFDLTFTKRFSNRWQALASYSYLKNEGNISDDGLYGSVGDEVEDDPRLWWNNGPLGFGRDHFIQLMGSYRFDFGLTVGVELRTYSGFNYSLAVSGDDANGNSFSGPWNGDTSVLASMLTYDPLAWAGPLGYAIEEGEVVDPDHTFDGDVRAAMAEQVDPTALGLRAGRGAYELPWFNQLNIRLKQDFPVFKKVRGEFFLDVFNVLNRQHTVTVENAFLNIEPVTPDNLNDRSNLATFRPVASQAPRSFNAGVRFAF